MCVSFLMISKGEGIIFTVEGAILRLCDVSIRSFFIQTKINQLFIPFAPCIFGWWDSRI